MQWWSEAVRGIHRTAGHAAGRLRRDCDVARAFRNWEAFCTSLTGLTVPADAVLTAELQALLGGGDDVTAAEALFALQSTFVLFCHCSVAHVLGHDPTEVCQDVIGDKVHVSPAHPLFRESWQFSAAGLREWSDQVAQWWGDVSEDKPQFGAPIFGQLYQQMFPPKARRLLGEFHTPVQLADQLLADVPALAQAGARVIDPACGCGIFVDAVLRRKRAAGGSSLGALLASVFGLEVNPAALAGTWASYCFRVADLLRGNHQPVSIPVALVNGLSLAPAGETTMLECRPHAPREATHAEREVYTSAVQGRVSVNNSPNAKASCRPAWRVCRARRHSSPARLGCFATAVRKRPGAIRSPSNSETSCGERAVSTSSEMARTQANGTS